MLLSWRKQFLLVQKRRAEKSTRFFLKVAQDNERHAISAEICGPREEIGRGEETEQKIFLRAKVRNRKKGNLATEETEPACVEDRPVND